MKIGIIGIGLIGGSLSKDLKKILPDTEIFGLDHNPEHLKTALELKLIDKIGDDSMIEEADIIYLAIPVDAAVSALPDLLDRVKDDALVIDAGSTKSLICSSVSEHAKRRNFLACHPIAGT
ncbi:MAG: prephenate dehydrogenase/arogenate dehydrogenase family protein, partial [Muriicola sp.]|nr:prephenate dehydrogenase/arogenate dehydrogenase family protein [Muriicola sp.]